MKGNNASASKHVAFADDLNGIDTVESPKNGSHFLKKKEANLVII